MSRPTVIVFLPAHDEEAMVSATLARLRAVQARCAPDLRIVSLLVDDGSRDDTVARAKAAGVDRVVHHESPRGLGAATRTGLLHAWAERCDAAVKLDADGQYDPEDIPRVVAPLIRDEADLVWGVRSVYRYRMPFVRRVGNRVFRGVMRALTRWPLSDPQTGLMAFSRRFLDGFTLMADYNPPQVLLVDAARRRLRYAEVPIAVEARTTGRSFVSWRYPFLVVTNLARQRFATH